MPPPTGTPLSLLYSPLPEQATGSLAAGEDDDGDIFGQSRPLASRRDNATGTLQTLSSRPDLALARSNPVAHKPDLRRVDAPVATRGRGRW